MLTFLRKKMKVIMIVVAVVFVGSMFYGVVASRGQGGGQSKVSNEIAKVNGQKLDPFRYREILTRLARQFGEKLRPQDMAFVQNLALGQTVEFMLILDQAKKNVKVSNREIDMAVAGLMKKEGLTSKKELEQVLKNAGLTMRKFRQLVKDEMLVQKMIAKVRGEVKVAPDDLREIQASHILLTTEAEAKEIKQRLKNGESFSSLATQYSRDPGSGKKGGSLGYFPTGAMVEPFENTAFALKIGEISEPVKTKFGYHIIKVTDSRLRKFPKEQDMEKAALAEKQAKVFRKWFSDIKNNAKVVIINPALKAHDLRFKGMIAEAAQEYKKAIAADPSNPYLHVFLGDCYNTVGKSELAVAEYKSAIAVAGGNPELYVILAQYYQNSGNKAEAIKQYRRASLVSGDDKAAHEALLKIFQELKAWDNVAREKREIARIEKKEKFEKELTGTK